MLSQRHRLVLDFVAPPALRRGDVLSVIAPSGAFDRTLFWRGMGWLAEHFRLRFQADVCSHHGFTAGSPERRLRELDAALSDEQARGIVCARGGYGAGEIAAHAAFVQLRRKPKWLIGFSDVTALHVEAQRLGVMSLHAHNITGLGPGDAEERERWLSQVICGPEHEQVYTLSEQQGPTRRGVLVGGNLTLVHQATIAGRFRPPPGAVLFLEEVAEAPYRLARLLLGLESAGVFDTLSAIVVGQITPSCADRHGVTPFEVFARTAERHGLSLGWGLAIGHERPNAPLVLGGNATLHGAALRVTRR